MLYKYINFMELVIYNCSSNYDRIITLNFYLQHKNIEFKTTHRPDNLYIYYSFYQTDAIIENDILELLNVLNL